MKKTISFVSVAIILAIAGCTSTNQANQTSKLIGNKQLLSEVLNLSEMSQDNKTTVEMLENFSQKVQGDPFAEDLINEAIWLARFGENEHIGHSLSWLALYIKDGTKLACPGHEIEHVELFVKHNNFDLLNDTVSGLEESYPQWKQDAYARQAKYPAFYRNLDNITSTIDQAMAKIRSGNYNVSEEADYLSINNIC